MTVAGSTISGFGGSGISFLGGSTASSLGGFTVSNNRTGVSVAAGDYTGTSISQSTVITSISNGIQLATGTNNLTITNSRVSGNGASGIAVQGGSGNTISSTIAGLTAAGTAAQGNAVNGIAITGASGTLITGVVSSGNTRDGIYIQNGATGTTISNAMLGVDATGTVAIANGQNGLHILSANSTTIDTVNASSNKLHGVFLRGTSSGTSITKSVLSGNTQNGLLLNNAVANTTVTNSSIGVTSTGVALGNGQNGISVITTGANTVVKSSTISNNGQYGIITTAANGGEIGGLGKADGNTIAKNAVHGISLRGAVGGSSLMRVGGNTVSGSTIGLSLYGTTGVEVVSGLFLNNRQHGIYSSGVFVNTTVKGVTARGNLNGIRIAPSQNLSFDGTVAAIRLEGNTGYGVLAHGDCTGTEVKGAIMIEGQYGVGLNIDSVRNTSGLTVSNNIIINTTIAGVIVNPGSVTKVAIVGNTLSGNATGVLISGSGAAIGSSTGTTVDDPDGNIITSSKGAGVRVVGTAAVDNPILSNSIYGNAGGGIILEAGGNAGQVSPTVTGATIAGATITITGTLSGTAGDQYRVQYFSSLASDATTAAAVQGRLLLGYEDVTISGGGTTVIDKVFAQGDILVNDWASATATLLVSGTPKNTSPFALGRKVV